MTKIILDRVKFRASPEELFEMSMNSEKHSSITGSPANVGRETGASFSAYDEYITGRTLLHVPSRIIVQTWRGSDWKESDPDSILILSFEKIHGGFTKMEMVHASVPSKHETNLNQGWKKHYWDKWKKYFRNQKRTAGLGPVSL